MKSYDDFLLNELVGMSGLSDAQVLEVIGKIEFGYDSKLAEITNNFAADEQRQP
jgi:hypothetical protein